MGDSRANDRTLPGHPAAGIRQPAFVSLQWAFGSVCGAVEGAVEDLDSGTTQTCRAWLAWRPIPIKRPGCEVLVPPRAHYRTAAEADSCLCYFLFVPPDLSYHVRSLST